MIDADNGLVILAGALLIDQVFGEYSNRFHPVAWMGRSIRTVQKLWVSAPVPDYFIGFIIAIGIPAFWATSAYLVLEISKFNEWLYYLLAILIFKASFALKALGYASLLIGKLLKQGDVDKARFELRSLCSRDASQLPESDLLSASIASTAENLSDSFVAPLFYFILFGIPGAIAYRAINTLDAMLGYMDHRRWVGHFSAKLDDLANYIPARITGGLLILAAKMQGMAARRGVFIMIRDHFQTPSPNGGWPMAAMAGLLDIEITKPGVYRLGEAGQNINFTHLEKSWRVASWAAWISVAITFIILGLSYV